MGTALLTAPLQQYVLPSQPCLTHTSQVTHYTQGMPTRTAPASKGPHTPLHRNCPPAIMAQHDGRARACTRATLKP